MTARNDPQSFPRYYSVPTFIRQRGQRRGFSPAMELEPMPEVLREEKFGRRLRALSPVLARKYTRTVQPGFRECASLEAPVEPRRTGLNAVAKGE